MYIGGKRPVNETEIPVNETDLFNIHLTYRSRLQVSFIYISHTGRKETCKLDRNTCKRDRSLLYTSHIPGEKRPVNETEID